MAYVIEYGGQVGVAKRQRKSKQKTWIAVCCVLLLLLCVYGLWPEAVEHVRHILIPGDDAVTVAAFQTMMDNVRSGDRFSDCLTMFFRDVIYGTQ